ncbi:MAG: hypothetical protein Q8T11_12870 [Elusimicrobiota bacterium]|nr:hypothetical protein [Elusimicrobiota bacterium]
MKIMLSAALLAALAAPVLADDKPAAGGPKAEAVAERREFKEGMKSERKEFRAKQHEKRKAHRSKMKEMRKKNKKERKEAKTEAAADAPPAPVAP